MPSGQIMLAAALLTVTAAKSLGVFGLGLKSAAMSADRTPGVHGAEVEKLIKGTDNRLSAKEVDYMELKGAKKDDDCYKVYVEGGVSSKLGCCNAFKPESKDTQRFRCGDCKFLRSNR